jgi:hypothetical protein
VGQDTHELVLALIIAGENGFEKAIGQTIDEFFIYYVDYDKDGSSIPSRCADDVNRLKEFILDPVVRPKEPPNLPGLKGLRSKIFMATAHDSKNLAVSELSHYECMQCLDSKRVGCTCAGKLQWSVRASDVRPTAGIRATHLPRMALAEQAKPGHIICLESPKSGAAATYPYWLALVVQPIQVCEGLYMHCVWRAGAELVHKGAIPEQPPLTPTHPPTHTHTHTHAHAHAHTHAHACTHTHTHTHARAHKRTPVNTAMQGGLQRPTANTWT